MIGGRHFPIWKVPFFNQSDGEAGWHHVEYVPFRSYSRGVFLIEENRKDFGKQAICLIERMEKS